MYSQLLDEEGINSQYLVVIKPRRLLETDSWILSSGTKYTQAFSFGEIISLNQDDSSLTEASTSSLSDGDYFFDEDTSILYIDIGSDPSGFDIVATYELYFGTFDAHFNRVPSDGSTRVVYYEPLITKSPDIQSSNTDLLFGFLPSQSTNITISNLTQYLQEHLYASSFNRAEIDVYHYLDELITENVKLVTSGICGNISYDDTNLNITIFDNNDLFNAEFRHIGLESFFATSDFPELDPNFQSRPIRKVYGVVDGFIPVNIDYKSINPTTSDNRTWVCLKPHTNLCNITRTVGGGVSTSTRTYVTSAHGIRVGDSLWLDSQAGAGFDEFMIVTVVNKSGAHYIEHAAITNVAVNGDSVKRSFVGNVTIYKEGVSYTALYGKHYDNYTDSFNSVAGFTFLTTLESDLSISTLSPQDLLYARVYGNTNQVTLNALPFGTNSNDTSNLTDPIVTFFDLLTNYLGLDESKIDLTAFEDLQGEVTDQIGFSIPQLSSNNFPTFKDLFTQISQTVLLKIFIDDSNLFSITQTGPKGASSKTIQDDEIMDSTFKYDFDYRDIRSDIFVQYGAREVSVRNLTGNVYYSLVNASNPLASRLHGIQKQETFTSLHFLSSDAQILANRLSYALGDRRGTMSFIAKTRFFDSEINEVVTVSRTKMPGFSYDGETLYDNEGVVISLQKSLTEIIISLDDQKGIEDNSASW